jgi:hypothetical protein
MSLSETILHIIQTKQGQDPKNIVHTNDHTLIGLKIEITFK